MASAHDPTISSSGAVVFSQFFWPAALQQLAGLLANGTWVPMATVHFPAMTGALLAGWMGCGLRASAFNVNRVNATDLSLLVRPSAGFGG